jgi:hypothetical protein
VALHVLAPDCYYARYDEREPGGALSGEAETRHGDGRAFPRDRKCAQRSKHDEHGRDAPKRTVPTAMAA